MVINPSDWDEKNQCIKKPSGNILDAQKKRLIKLTDEVDNRKKLIRDLFLAHPNPESLTSVWLVDAIDKTLHPEKYKEEEAHQQTIFEAFDEFLDKRSLSDIRKKNFKVIRRALQRFELFKSLTAPFTLTFDSLTLDVLIELEDYLFNEHTICEEHKAIYEAISESRKPVAKGQNTINDIYTKIRTFMIWANTPDPTTKIAKTANNAFGRNGYKINECVYGTPYYITIEERNKLYNHDFSDNKELAIQRDIFVFQCLIGCRVGDLYNMTKANVINGAVEYVARKTNDKKKITVRVPLIQMAKDILNKYPDCETLLPFTIEQYYNVAIKEMFQLAGLTRIVTVINPKTGLAEQRPINEVASSHLARRCFIGNLYKQVKDPNLVGVLSGHKEGSKAFSRYRELSEEMKIDTVKLLE
ncbi:MAG: phage integrase SAM-like domain-containing protein [Paludibacter sp.]|nr:phage integrase SAM-like domain-containing protein [Paludibacter sp.]